MTKYLQGLQFFPLSESEKRRISFSMPEDLPPPPTAILQEKTFMPAIPQEKTFMPAIPQEKTFMSGIPQEKTFMPMERNGERAVQPETIQSKRAIDPEKTFFVPNQDFPPPPEGFGMGVNERRQCKTF